jgi:TPR repeat protein
MLKTLVTIALAGLMSGLAAAQGVPSEAALRQEVEQALWPNDIAELATDYMRLYPANPGGSWARELRERARIAMRALNSEDVKLYKSAFQPHRVPLSAPPTANEDLRKSALGDKDAAYRVAKVYEQPDATSGPELDRYAGWLQFAARLGNEKAAYDLALLYRRLGQPQLAAKFEARAIELGFKPPPALDHIRK